MISRKATIALLTGAAICLGMGGAAHAADIYSPPPEPAYTPAPEAFSWTGIYFGINGGFGGNKFAYDGAYWGDFADYDEGLDPDVSGFADITSSGFFGGAQIGGNWQAGSLLLGVEADAEWSDITGELNLGIDNFGSISGYSTVDWFGTIRGRIGFLATPRFLVYATGGGAWGKVESGYSVESPLCLGECFGDSTSDTQWGWTAGGGFEYAITDHVTFKTEYLYVDLGSQTLYNDDLLGDDNLTIDVDTKFHTVKAGFNVLW